MTFSKILRYLALTVALTAGAFMTDSDAHAAICWRLDAAPSSPCLADAQTSLQYYLDHDPAVIAGTVHYIILSCTLDNPDHATCTMRADDPAHSGDPSFGTSVSKVDDGCPSGQHSNGSTCVPNVTCPAAGTKGGPSGSVSGTGAVGGLPPNPICSGGCSYTWGGVGMGDGSGNWFAWPPFTSTGSSCTATTTGNTAPPDNKPPVPCGAGTCPGTVNGVSVCLKCTNTTQQTPSTSTTTAANGDTTKKDTTTTTTVNNDNSVTTTTTTTTTVTPSGGGTPTTSTESKAETKTTPDFCKDNPSLQMCKQSDFGGACGAFACTGDAIQCAMAKEQYTRNCTLFDTATPQSNLGNAMAAGTDPDAATLPQHPSQLTTVPVGTISTDTFLSGGTLSDQTIAVGDRSFVIPWSKWNSVLSIMGYVVMAFAMLAAYKIIGGVK